MQKLRQSKASKKDTDDSTNDDGDNSRKRSNMRSRTTPVTKESLESDSGVDRVVIDIVTKVWYTHLGYERTTRAVMDTINNLND